MHNPIHVTNHPAVVEYLGADYPLLFDNVSSLQAVLQDKVKLLLRMRRAHRYLKALPKESLSLNSFTNELTRTVQQALAEPVPLAHGQASTAQ